jgi:hypothetical protein
MVDVLGEDCRPCGRIEVFAVDTEAGQVWPDQDAPQRCRTPAAASCWWHATCIQFSAERGEGLASKGAASHLPDDGCLIGFDGAEVDSVAIAPRAAMGAAMLGQFLLLAADPPGDVVGLLGVDPARIRARNRSSGSGHQSRRTPRRYARRGRGLG